MLNATVYAFDPLPPSYGTTFDMDYFQKVEDITRQHPHAPFQEPQPGDGLDDVAVRDLFHEILIGAAGAGPAQIRESVMRLHEAIDRNDGRLGDEQRDALLDLLGAFMLQLEEMEVQEDNREGELEVREEREEREEVEEEMRNGIRGMPGGFDDEVNEIEEEGEGGGDQLGLDEAGVGGLMETLLGWIGRR